MLKVFLVEDESVVREGLRDNIPWQQYGYRFVGEAQDGEMALPLIRKTQPDVLITDIKMPFMDGLSLSHIVGQEFPDMKVIIISGYDDFEYARRAIHEGVEQYLLKPITRSAMQKVLAEVKEKIESEQEQRNYMKKFQSEMQEYEQFFLRNFFEQVFAGKLSVQEIYEEAQKHSLDINAPCYNLVFVSIQEKRKGRGQEVQWTDGEKEQNTEECREELMRYFLRFSEYQVFCWNINTYGIMIKGETELMKERTRVCLENIERICGEMSPDIEWYAAAGTPVERFSLLAECYAKLNHIFSYRFFFPSQHILTENLLEGIEAGNDEGIFDKIDASKVDPEIIKGFLVNGQQADIEEFTRNYLDGLKEPLKSKLFRDYLLLSVRFATLAYVESIGCSQEEFLEKVSTDKIQEMVIDLDKMEFYIRDLLEQAVAFREQESNNQGKKLLKKALSYIEENYTKENLSLNAVAGYIEVSPNYFSAMFSQEMQMTFIEYVTEKRMEKAKKLLSETEMHSGEIAAAIGYKDPHYFSFVFKKTQGCTPREYHYSKVKHGSENNG